MYVARILYPVRVLGPGCRVGIWLAGCHHACPGCSNPELWEVKQAYQTSVAVVLELIAKISGPDRIDGFTVTGGEPFEQSEELSELLAGLCKWSGDILLYSGYELSELKAFNKSSIEQVLGQTAVLIDGRYREAENVNLTLRGSANQQIHYLQEQYRIGYEEYLLRHHEEVQNFTTTDGVISVGIHRVGYETELDMGVRRKGLVEESQLKGLAKESKLKEQVDG